MIEGPKKLWVLASNDGDWHPFASKYDADKQMKLERKRWPNLRFKVIAYERALRVPQAKETDDGK